MSKMSKMNVMIKFDLQFYYFLIPLKQEVLIAGKKVSTREGIYIKIVDSDGYFGVGECAPLIGVHQETLDDCLSALEELKEDFRELKIDPKNFNLQERFLGLLNSDDDDCNDDYDVDDSDEDNDDENSESELPVSLIFALEEALLLWYLNRYPAELKSAFEKYLDLQNLQECKSKDEYERKTSVPIFKLILKPPANEKAYEKIVNELKDMYIPAMKVKINSKRSLLEKQLSFIKKIYFDKDLNANIKIVLDLNLGFLVEDLDYLIKYIEREKIKIEYFEDATSFDFIPKISKYKNSIKLGLDELLFDFVDENEHLRVKDLPSNARAIIFKPTVVTLSSMFKLVKEMYGDKCHCQHKEKIPEHNQKIIPVLSSTYDSSLTLMVYSLIYSNCFCFIDKFPQGLGTFDFVASNTDPMSAHAVQMKYERGRLLFDLCFRSIDKSLMELTRINI
ncbi:MAG: hypothetical protein HQK49_11185 [Oligoflexia bacterium]|nr:hypothetical protein [Oligoflexia bacterium]